MLSSESLPLAARHTCSCPYKVVELWAQLGAKYPGWMDGKCAVVNSPLMLQQVLFAACHCRAATCPCFYLTCIYAECADD